MPTYPNSKPEDKAPAAKKERSQPDYYLDPGCGRLFPAAKKPNSKQPDMRGTINIEGVRYDLSGWLRLASENKKYLELRVRKKEVKQKNPLDELIPGD